MQPAHANRFATTEQLPGSAAHEVRQPVGPTAIGVDAALGWLDSRPPALREVRQALGRIVQRDHGAKHVVRRIHDLIKKASPARIAWMSTSDPRSD